MHYQFLLLFLSAALLSSCFGTKHTSESYWDRGETVVNKDLTFSWKDKGWSQGSCVRTELTLRYKGQVQKFNIFLRRILASSIFQKNDTLVAYFSLHNAQNWFLDSVSSRRLNKTEIKNQALKYDETNFISK